MDMGGILSIVTTLIVIPIAFIISLFVFRQISNLSNRLCVYHREEPDIERFKNLVIVYFGLSIPLILIFYTLLESLQPEKDHLMLFFVTTTTTFMIILLCRALSLLDPKKSPIPLDLWQLGPETHWCPELLENKRVSDLMYSLSTVSTISFLLMAIINYCMVGAGTTINFGYGPIYGITMYLITLTLTILIGEYILKDRVINTLIQ